jgi:signal transduction histidine kinase
MRGRIVRWARSLSAKYIALFALLIAVPVVGTSIYLLNSSYNDNKSALVRLQQEKARALAVSIDQVLSQEKTRLAAIDLRGVPPARRGLVLQAAVASNPNIESIDYIARKDARRLISVDTRNVGGPSRRDFEQARAHSFFLGQPFNGISDAPGFASRDIEVYILARTWGTGVVAEDFTIGFAVQDAVRQAHIGASGYAYVTDAKGFPIFRPDNSKDNVVEYPGRIQNLGTRFPQVAQALHERRETASTTGSNFRGQRVLSAWATVPSSRWKVFVEEPESAAFAPLRGKIWRTALLLAAFLGGALVLSLLLARRLVRPIRRMQVAAAAIGGGAYDERIELERRDELGALADDFNRMAESLQEAHAGLERKVEERTRELEAALRELADKSRQLEVASTHKSEFLAGMSHELRTPLNAVVGFSQILREKMYGPLNEKQEEYVDDILSSANHLLSLINDILDLSKVEAGQVELEVATFSLREALERGIVVVRERASKNGVVVELNLDPSVDLVEGDERRIRQVVFNLLSNAVKFTPNGGRIDVSAARVDGEVRVAVTDTGLGIAPEDRERIFEEFQQAQTVNGERPEGTGLGLALSRTLVELHGGRLWVDSDVGKGSTFTFTLPLEAS